MMTVIEIKSIISGLFDRQWSCGPWKSSAYNAR